MPRTKQPRKTSASRETSEECDALVRDFERLANKRIHKMEADMKMRISSLANSVDVALSRLPPELRKLTLGELIAADDLDDDKNEDDEDVDMESPVPATVKTKKKQKRVTAASDDGYATECTTRTTHVSRINTTRNSNGRATRAARSSSSNGNSSRQTRANRSCSRNRNNRTTTTTNNETENRNDLLKTSHGPPKTVSKFKTPSVRAPAPCFDTVTPKVKPNTPMNILRRPKDGEMVLSMQGSPLLVSSIVQERTANINVPLHNGNVISLLPNAGFRLSHMPALDNETMQQLKMLKAHIDMVVGSK